MSADDRDFTQKEFGEQLILCLNEFLQDWEDNHDAPLTEVEVIGSLESLKLGIAIATFEKYHDSKSDDFKLDDEGGPLR